jgi:hypothetical protein
MKLEFYGHVKKIIKHQISLKFVQWEPNCFMQTNGQAAVTKLIVAFRKTANAPKNGNTATMLTIIFMIGSGAYLGRNIVGDLLRQPLNVYLYFDRPFMKCAM